MKSEEEEDGLIQSPWIIENRWKVIEKIASGGFGAIYRAIDTVNEDVVAVKIEKRNDKNYLEKEIKFYEKLQGKIGVPKLIWSGDVKSLKDNGGEGSSKVLMLEYLGYSLSDLFYKNNKKFSLKTVLMIAIQMITRLECCHEFGIVHRDVKPGNFIMGKGIDRHIVYIIDFGLASEYLDENGKHIPNNKKASFRGTHRYASINSHRRREQSRRDDLEALGYVLIYFLKGSLPWQNLKAIKKDRRKVIGNRKKNTSIESLTSETPEQFFKYMKYVKQLKFRDTPDYNYLRQLFIDRMQENKFEHDYIYDWTKKDANSSSSSSSLSVSSSETERKK